MKLKIMEDEDAVLVVPEDTNPDDIVFGRAKILAVFQHYGEAEKWLKQQEERLETWRDHGHLHR